MSELCNNSACFSVEIKGTSDIYSSSKSLMIILPFMEEAICYCNNAKLTIESFSYLGQLNNYITLLIQPVRKFFRAGCSCFTAFFLCKASFLKSEKAACIFPDSQPESLRYFLPGLFCCASSGIHFYKAGHSYFLLPSRQIPACFEAPVLCGTCRCTAHTAGSLPENISRRPCTAGSKAPSHSACSDNR